MGDEPAKSALPTAGVSGAAALARRGPIVVGLRRRTHVIGLTLSIVALLVTGGWVLPRLGLFPPVVLAVGFMSIGVATFAYQLATGPYVFRLDERGLHDRAGLFQAGRLAWDEIARAAVVVASGREQVGVTLTEAALARRSVMVRELMATLRSSVGADVVIAPEAIGAGPAREHVALIERYRLDPAARAELSEGS